MLVMHGGISMQRKKPYRMVMNIMHIRAITQAMNKVKKRDPNVNDADISLSLEITPITKDQLHMNTLKLELFVDKTNTIYVYDAIDKKIVQEY